MQFIARNSLGEPIHIRKVSKSEHGYTIRLGKPKMPFKSRDRVTARKKRLRVKITL